MCEKRRSQKGSSKKVMFLVPFGWPGPSRIKLPLKRELNPALYHSFAIWSPKDLQKGVKMEVKTEKIAFKGENDGFVGVRKSSQQKVKNMVRPGHYRASPGLPDSTPRVCAFSEKEFNFESILRKNSILIRF